jgi:hypothetical protein
MNEPEACICCGKTDYDHASVFISMLPKDGRFVLLFLCEYCAKGRAAYMASADGLAELIAEVEKKLP